MKAMTPEDIYTLIRGKTPRGFDMAPSWDDLGSTDALIDPRGSRELLAAIIAFAYDIGKKDATNAVTAAITADHNNGAIAFINSLCTALGANQTGEIDEAGIVALARALPDDHPLVKTAPTEIPGQLNMEFPTTT
jgi:hypothetical protein